MAYNINTVKFDIRVIIRDTDFNNTKLTTNKNADPSTTSGLTITTENVIFAFGIK